VSADRRRAELSQHFLRKGATAARLVEATSISRADLVIEIGAGRGALTLPLSRRAGRLIAVELDCALAARLDGRFDRHVEIVAADFLDFTLPEGAYKAFGNVPFASTTDIVRKLVRAPNPPDDAWLVVQREAAQRFCGAPYVGESLWSLRLKPWWHVEIVDRLRRVDFEPPPSVESVLVWLSHRGRALLDQASGRLYLDLVECAFDGNQSVQKATARWISRTEMRRLAQDLRFGADFRASMLSFEQWLGIVRFVRRMKRGE
jgi:23S rRNA (adenine-N6)-dimethyltransferase